MAKRLTDEERDRVAANLGLTGKFVGRLGLATEYHDGKDAMQDAALGVMEAVRTHKPRKGKLSTHAFQHMKQQTLVGHRGRQLVHVPAYIWDAMSAERRGREPKQAVRPDCLDAAKRCLGVGSFSAFDDADPPAPDHVSEVELADDIEHLRESLSTLTPIERDVIESRFWRRETLKAIGERHGLTNERIRQIQNAAIAKLRGFLEGNDNA